MCVVGPIVQSIIFGFCCGYDDGGEAELARDEAELGTSVEVKEAAGLVGEVVVKLGGGEEAGAGEGAGGVDVEGEEGVEEGAEVGGVEGDGSKRERTASISGAADCGEKSTITISDERSIYAFEEGGRGVLVEMVEAVFLFLAMLEGLVGVLASALALVLVFALPLTSASALMLSSSPSSSSSFASSLPCSAPSTPLPAPPSRLSTPSPATDRTLLLLPNLSTIP